MASIKAGKKKALRRRRIIERPRLTALLDESSARVLTLVAPAGYGKTTLADQWVAKEGRRRAWYAARPSSTDVAALALGLARAATTVVPGCDARLREHLRALPAPAEHVDVLAELLSEDLAEWPQDGWLVLDDYQEIVGAADAEEFVEALVAQSAVQLLITSRQRPSWVTSRRILYGEVLEVTQTELAMDGHEAAEVLVDRDTASASGLVALARGWPAVIGLAGVTEAEIGAHVPVPDSLYQFFADEVFSALAGDVQAGLTTLAISPVLDRPLATKLLGDSADRTCGAALGVGILVERDAQLEIHPLARAFLETQREQADGAAVASCVDYFRARHDWDAAYEVITRHGEPIQLEGLLEEALDELLETARLSTIDLWSDHIDQGRRENAIAMLARAEVALRRGHLASARAHAESAASASESLQFRALMIAGRAAHLSSHEDEALADYRRAEAVATTEGLRREAAWGQTTCLADLERPEALDKLHELKATPGPWPARELLRAVTQELMVHARLGALDLTSADRATEIVDNVTDPLVKSSFLSVYSATLALSARYSEALEAAEALLALAKQYRLEFAIPWACCYAGTAHAGLRGWAEAERRLNRGLELARAGRNAHAEQTCLAALYRVLLQQGQYEIGGVGNDYSPQVVGPIPSQMKVEFVATRALVGAAAGRLDEAEDAVDRVRGLSNAGDARVLVQAVDALVSARRHDINAIDRANGLLDTAFTTGAVDPLVVTYRASPEMLAILLRSRAAQIAELMRRVGDEDLSRSLGYSIAADGPARADLTARERDVIELLRQDLTNREIAALLFIAEPTVKLHVQHIFDKLGVRSRKAIVMQAVLERSSQATSAMDDIDVDEGS